MEDEDGREEDLNNFEEEIIEAFDEEEDEGVLTKEQVLSKIKDNDKIIQKFKSLGDEFKLRLEADLKTKKEIYGIGIRNDRKSSYIAVLVFGIMKNLYFDPYLLALENNMTKKEINSCLKVISGNDTKKKSRHIIPVHIFHPRNFIPTFINSKNILEEDIATITQKVEDFYEKYFLFLESANPRATLAYVIKRYYTVEKDPPLEKIPGMKSFSGSFSKVALREIEQIVLNDLTIEKINPEYEEKKEKEEEKKKSKKNRKK